jgi:hypothetical protein
MDGAQMTYRVEHFQVLQGSRYFSGNPDQARDLQEALAAARFHVLTGEEGSRVSVIINQRTGETHEVAGDSVTPTAVPVETQQVLLF